jgi:FkbM family methyltransferase
MSLARSLFRKTVVRGLWLAVGRRNLVRLSRALTMEARLDVANDMAGNGERLVQQGVLAHGPGVVLDVGANVGEWTAALLDEAARRGVGGVVVHCFEPASATYRALAQRLARHGAAAVAVRQALSSAPGTAELTIFGEGLGINSLHAGVAVGAQGTETVELTTADAYCAARGLDRLALLKIDAEGHDLEVLEGARGLLAARRVAVVQFEYNHRWIEARRFLRDAFELLVPAGYRLGKVTPRGIEFYPRWHFELESFREGNYVACLPEAAGWFPQVPWWGP